LTNEAEEKKAEKKEKMDENWLTRMDHLRLQGVTEMSG